MPTPQEHLDEARTLHGRGDFKKGMKAAQKARKKFLKDDQPGQAREALRVMADCALNQHDFGEAKRLYKELIEEAKSAETPFYEAAGNWGLGETACHQMDYRGAIAYFEMGLKHAKSVGDKWYTAWNAFGLGKAYRGIGEAGKAIPFLKEAKRIFKELGHATFVTWIDKILGEIGDDKKATDDEEVRIWLCPICGSKLQKDTVEELLTGDLVSCQYCGTTIG